MKPVKLKAGALQLTLFISVVIAVLLASFLLYVHVYNKFSKQTQEVKQSIQYAEAGIQYALSHSIPVNDSVVLSGFDQFPETTVAKSFWGLFEKVISTTHTAHKSFKSTALLGGTYPSTGTALYVGNIYKALVVSGKTRIKGDAYLAPQGIKPGNMGGENYYGDLLLYGNQHKSKGLMELSPGLLNHLNQLPEAYTTVAQGDFIALEGKKEFRQSFLQPTRYLYQASPLYVEGVTLKGNIIIQSAASITISSNVNLSQVILLAPHIEFEEGFTGNCQAIASEKLIVHKNCHLNYPSALWVQPDPDSKIQVAGTGKEDMPLVIEEGTEIKGVVGYYYPVAANKNFQSQIFMEPNTKLYGELFCTHQSELQGSVFGSVYSMGFIAHYGSSVFQNHLHSAVINNDSIHKAYGGLLWKDDHKKSIVAWLH